MSLSARPQGGGRPATVTRYRSVLRPGHPLADKDGRVRTHRLVLFERIGGDPTRCHWCGCDVEWFGVGPKQLVADHVDRDKWNNDPSNIVPACFACNVGRRQRAETTCIAGHPLEGANLYVRPDTGARQCRACKKAASLRAEAKRPRRSS